MSWKKKIIIAVCGIGLVFILVFLVIFNSDVAKVNRNLKLAQRHLLEEDYEQAIDAFAVVIEIDPKNTEAYIGLAQAYVETENLEKAVKLLERRAKRGDSAEIQKLLDLYAAELAEGETLQEADSEAAAVSSHPESVESEIAEMTPQSPPEAAVVNTGFQPQGGELYYYDELGSVVVGWFEVGGSRYYAGADGRLYRDGEYEVDSVKYLFDANGICLREVKDEAWKQAYIDYIRNDYKWEFHDYTTDYIRFWFIYINDDDIPEMVWLGRFEGVGVMTYSNGTLDSCYGDCFSYMKKKNLFRFNQGGSDGDIVTDSIYAIIGGKIVLVSEGNCDVLGNADRRCNEATTIGYHEVGEHEAEYRWNGRPVTKEEYNDQLRKVYDYDEADEMTNEPYYSYEQIFDVITNY